MSNRLEDLEVYQLAESFSDEIWFIVLEWDYFAKDTSLVHWYRFDKQGQNQEINLRKPIF